MIASARTGRYRLTCPGLHATGVPARSEVLAAERLYPLEIVLVQAEVGRPGDAVDLVRPTAPDDGGRHGRVPQGPGDGYLGGRGVVAPPDLAQLLDELEVLGELGLLEVLGVAPPVVGGKFSMRSRVILPVNRPLAIGE